MDGNGDDVREDVSQGRKSSVSHVLNLMSIRPTCSCPQVVQEKAQG